MKAGVKHIVKKVTLELIYDVVDERTRKLKDELKEMRNEYQAEFKAIRQEINEMRTEFRNELKAVKEDFKTVNTRIDQIHTSLNGRIDQIHTRLDQIMHMLSDIKRA